MPCDYHTWKHVSFKALTIGYDNEGVLTHMALNLANSKCGEHLCNLVQAVKAENVSSVVELLKWNRIKTHIQNFTLFNNKL